MNPQLNAAPERLRAATVGLFALIVFSGCILLPDPEPEPPPAFDLESCSGDHATHYNHDDEVELWGEDGPADKDCNDIGFFAGDAFQGGSVFHIEPITHLEFPEGHQPIAVTYELYAMDGAAITSQGRELYPEYSDIQAGVFEDKAELLFDQQWRGKNLRVVVYATFLDQTSNEYERRAEAAFYLSHENSP